MHCRVMPDGSAWYRLLDGWTAAHTDMGQRTLSPVSDSQPVAAIVKGLRFQEVDGAGWFGSKVRCGARCYDVHVHGTHC
jgi:hypothetical protein